MAQNIPERIGRYQVQALLGHGGMGNVYLALDPRLKRQLAIKTVRNREDDDQDRTLERFSREAEISAQLCHPNIITIYDVGEDPEAGAFLAMEYVKGHSLAAHIREHRPGFESSLYLLVQAMRALQAAHDGEIIHRDIKPENMMVSDKGRLKLMDFGLARGHHSRLTATGMVMGTPSFTAPELMMGKEPSASTDRYAFAVTAFELLSGSLPFTGDTLASTLYRIVHEPPSIPEGMDPRLADVFLKALSKVPDARHTDLKSFMLELISTCPIPPQVQSKLLNFVEAETSGQEMVAKESGTAGPSPAEATLASLETQTARPSDASIENVVPASRVAASCEMPPEAGPSPAKAVAAKPRQAGPPLKLNLSNLLGKPAAPAPPKPAAAKPPVFRIPAPSPRASTPKAGLPSPVHPGGFLLKIKPEPAPGPPPREPIPRHPHAELDLPEPIFDLEAGPIDDPFKDLDWDHALAFEVTPAQPLACDELVSALDEIDVLEVVDRSEPAEESAEAMMQVKEMESMLDGLTGTDVLEAENRAESEEAIHDLEDALGEADV